MDIGPIIGAVAAFAAFVWWSLVKGSEDPETKRIDEETARHLRKDRERRS